MIKFKELLLVMGVCSAVVSCKQTKDKSQDFTKEFGFTKGIEGPAVDSQHNLYAVNFKKEGTIGVVDKNGNTRIYATLPEESVGNGIRFDKYDNMFIADYVNHNVLLIPKGETEAVVYAHHPELNQPNDLAISPDGTLYASDPNWSDNTGKLWKVDKNGFTLLEDNLGTTNGIEVSNDGKKLFVNESVQRNIWVYEIDDKGNLKNKRLFYRFKDYGLDGMRCDQQGNLYVCRYDAGTVVVLSPEAKIIREVQLIGKKPSNITFGGIDNKSCFVTMADRGCFETFRAEFPGKGF